MQIIGPYCGKVFGTSLAKHLVLCARQDNADVQAILQFASKHISDPKSSSLKNLKDLASDSQKAALRKGSETRRQKAKLKRDQQQTGGSVVAKRLWARGRAAEPRNGLNFVR